MTEKRNAVKVLHVFGRMTRGGAEMRTLDVMKAIDRNRYLLHYCVLSGRAGELDGEVVELGGHVYPCKLDRKFRRTFRAILHEFEPQVVHSHVHYASGFVLREAKAAGIPVRIAHFRSTGDGRPKSVSRSFQARLLREWIHRSATNILAVSEAAMRSAWIDVRGQDSRCEVLYSGLDLTPYRIPANELEVRHEFGVPLDSPLFIDVGRIGAEKNQLKAVSVVSMLEALEGAAHLLLVGRRDATYEKRILSLAAERGFDDRILFAGVRNDVPRLLRGSDALIFPSLREGLPGVVLEACAAGIPVVASDLPGIVEIARYFNTVVPISPASSDADWATAVNRTLGMKVAPDVAIDRFLGTPFAIEQSVARLSILWSGGQTIAAH